MRDNNIKNRTISNLVWRFAERSGAQGVTFVVSIILARLLAPADYGIISLVTVVTSILQVFVDSGLGNALIQKKEADELDFSTVFYFNIVLCGLLYIVLFITAPFIAVFYKNITLTPLIRVLGLTIIISGVKNIQQAYVSKHLLFKRFFYSTIGGTFFSAIIGIIMAYNGFGVWSLAAQQITNNLVATLIIWFTIKWRPQFNFSFGRLTELFRYGWKLLASSLLNTIYNDLRQLIIGKTFSTPDLGFYNRGRQFPKQIVDNINSSIDSVLLPVMSMYQDDNERIKQLTRRAIMTSSYVMWPLMFGLMVTAKNVVEILLTEKWLPSVPYVIIFSFVFGLQPIHTANLNAIKAMGRSDLFLKMEIFKKIVGLIIILISMRISVLAMALSTIVYTLFAGIVNAYPNVKLLNYSYIEQIMDIMISFFAALIMAIGVYMLPIRSLNMYIQLPLQIISGGIFYLTISIVLKIESYIYIRKYIQNMFNK